LVFLSGRTVSGTVVQTNETNILLLNDYGAFNYFPSIVKEVRIERAEEPYVTNTNRLPSCRQALLLLGSQPWASNLKQIPATVIDKGIMRNVPYVSFRCGEDYEVNVYGDLDHPAGIEAGVYRNLLGVGAAKSDCLKFISRLLSQAADREIVQGLVLDKDLRTRDGLTFEITPPFAEDAYRGWWVSAYSERAFNDARASEEDLKRITVSKAAVGQGKEPAPWSSDELKLVRRVPPTVISFYSTGLGETIRKAEVKPYVQGISLLWRDATGRAGVVKLADLPEDLRAQFGYDADKAKAADEAEALKRAREWQDAQARAGEYAQVATDASAYTPGASPSGGGGSVYVRGYTRSNGTYVNGYFRSSGGGRR
jgi:hypothetical protein